MSIQAVSKHLNLRWETVKNIDKIYLEKTLPALDPKQIVGLKYIGVDESYCQIWCMPLKN